MFLIISLP